MAPLHAIAAGPYFPALAAGDNWAYRIELGSAGSDPKTTLNGVEVIGKNADGQFILARFNPKLAGDKQIMDILRTIEGDVCVMDPFYGTSIRRGARCEKPPKKGEVWRDQLKSGDRSMKIHVVFRGEETISVGAGQFNALKFECAAAYLDSRGRKFADIEIGYWYAPEVKGFVKVDSRETHEAGEKFLRATLEAFPAR